MQSLFALTRRVALIRSDFSRALWQDPDILRRTRRGTPLACIGGVGVVAGCAVFLASRAGADITGQASVVDGGLPSVWP